MADETGAVCDHCDPVRTDPAGTQSNAVPYCWATWSLFAVTAVASAVALTFTHERFPLGASFGPDVAAGGWWRLITAILVHSNLGHFLWNMIPLLFFGRMLERVLGPWWFLAFYFVAGITGSIVSLFAGPEIPSAGASGAVFGICGGLIAYYALRCRSLSRRQWIKLALFAAYVALALWPNRMSPGVDTPNHVGGFLSGLVLGLLLSTRLGNPAARRRWIFATATVLLVVGAAAFRQRNLYLIHIHYAEQALRSGQPEVAANELKTALDLNPDSRLGVFLVRKLQTERPSGASCGSLPLAPDRPNAMKEPCEVMQCDGRLHTMPAQHGATISWRGATSDSPATQRDGVWQKELKTRLVMEALDEFGEIACTVVWERTQNQPIDSNGAPVGKPTSTRESTSTLSAFDPEAVALRNDARHAKTK